MAKGYNIYTGVIRTPSSLKWLIVKRQRILGEIKELERVVERAPERIAKLNEKVAVLTTTIGMHEIPVDLDQIPPKRAYGTRMRLPYGAVARAIWKCFRESGNAPTLTSRFVQFVFIEQDIPMSTENAKMLRRVVVASLNDLVRKGKVHPIPPAKGNGERSWAITSYGELKVPRTMDSLPVAGPPLGTT